MLIKRKVPPTQPVSQAPQAPASIVIPRDKTILFVGIGIGVFFLSAVALLAAVFIYVYKVPAAAPATQKVALSEVVGKLSKLTDLPTSETPQIVPLNNLEPFKDQKFFALAQLGDVLVLYVNSHVAVIYDPSEGKIVNMSRISTVISPPSIMR